MGWLLIALRLAEVLVLLERAALVEFRGGLDRACRAGCDLRCAGVSAATGFTDFISWCPVSSMNSNGCSEVRELVVGKGAAVRGRWLIQQERLFSSTAATDTKERVERLEWKGESDERKKKLERTSPLEEARLFTRVLLHQELQKMISHWTEGSVTVTRAGS